MKKSIRYTAWGNWKAYLGNRCVYDFGLSEHDAKAWLLGYDISDTGQWHEIANMDALLVDNSKRTGSYRYTVK